VASAFNSRQSNPFPESHVMLESSDLQPVCVVASRLYGWFPAGVGILFLLNASLLCAEDSQADRDFFESRIRPILVNSCTDCHGEELAEGKLRLDLRDGWVRGGERGPAIVPGDPSASLLMHAVSYKDESLRMPPKDSGPRLTDSQIRDLEHWIRNGAFDPRDSEKVVSDIELATRDHWAFQPVHPPEIPADQHPIDFLIGQKLSANAFVPTPPADTQTLIRRMSFDLTGLPPTQAQLTTTAEQLPDLIGDLLSSPRYGERWGRHWLDVARYSDAKDGVLMYGDARIRPFAYTYRDYVIRAFNEDKPYDQFIREQLAADQLNLPPGASELAALGFLTLGRMFDNNRHDVIDDQIDVVGRGLLGLTLSCARCHDHKFDPVPTADYYSLYGIFASCHEPYDRPSIEEATESGKAFEAEFSAKLKEIQDQQQLHYLEQLKSARERTADYLVHVATTEPDVSETAIFFLSLTPEQLRPQITRRWRQMIARRVHAADPVFGPWHDLMQDPKLKPAEWQARGIDQRIIDGLVAAAPKSPAEVARTYGRIIFECWQRHQTESSQPDLSEVTAQTASGSIDSDPVASLLTSRDGPIWFPARDIASYLSRTPGDAYRGLVAQLDAIAVRHKDAAARAMALVDSEVLCDPVVFQRGDPAFRGTPVPRRFLTVLSLPTSPAFSQGSGRLELANAIVSPTNPLTARVWVNRVWMHHFGEPLVESPADFGLQTRKPMHGELLDFLADYFVRNGWRTKPLHELILTSRTFQRSSLVPDSGQFTSQLQTDPANTYYWRANRRRMDLEQMRDSMLAVTGELDNAMFGRPGLITDEANHRRTIYSFVERQNLPAIIQTFDFTNADTSTPRRGNTTVPQQALFAMNSAFVLQRAKSLSARWTDKSAAEVIPELWQSIYQRTPTDDEITLSVEFCQTGSLEQLAHALLMSNEFLFID
jgi:hypothetical protein